jgi:DNA polymerase-3 subunit epsilon
MICVADFETTSKNVFDAEILDAQFFALNDDLEIVSELKIRCNPYRYSEEAYAVHGISREECARYPRFEKEAEKIIAWFKEHRITEFWCHSNAVMFGKLVYYDWAVLRINLLNLGTSAYYSIARVKPFSTHSLCKLFQHEINSQSLSLSAVCDSLGIELQHHNARSDALACIAIMKRFLSRTTREDLYNLDHGVTNENKRALPVSRANSKKSNQRKGHSFILQE